jgi:versiconal hemiacetal acetate reductase
MIRSVGTNADEEIINRLLEISKREKVSMTTLAISWILSKGASPIIGLGSKQRIDDAVASLKYKISPKDAEYLEEPYLPKALAHY